MYNGFISREPDTSPISMTSRTQSPTNGICLLRPGCIVSACPRSSSARPFDVIRTALSVPHAMPFRPRLSHTRKPHPSASRPLNSFSRHADFVGLMTELKCRIIRTRKALLARPVTVISTQSYETMFKRFRSSQRERNSRHIPALINSRLLYFVCLVLCFHLKSIYTPSYTTTLLIHTSIIIRSSIIIFSRAVAFSITSRGNPASSATLVPKLLLVGPSRTSYNRVSPRSSTRAATCRFIAPGNFDSSWKCVANKTNDLDTSFKYFDTAQASPNPSCVEVPLPSSSMITRLLSLAALTIHPASIISCIKVEIPLTCASDAPTRHIMELNIGSLLLASQGTKHPI